jgi:hypothetical protein
LQRERKQIALGAIAEQTKIKLALLEALERDDISHWPRGIFGRSYVRTFARAIGLDPDSTVREFLTLHPDCVEAVPADLAEASAAGGDSGSRRPPMRLKFLLGSAISALPHLQASLMNGLLGLEKMAPVAAGRTTMARQPIQVAREPIRVAREPIRVAREPIRVGREPIRVTREPIPLPPEVSAVPDVEPAAAASVDVSAGHRHYHVDFSVLADLCTRLGRALEVDEVMPALEDAACALDAVGLILWMHDPTGGALIPVLAHGYSDEVLARLPRVPSHTDNAIATAFQSVETHVVQGTDVTTGALVVPLSPPTGCAGVLALEFRDGAEQDATVRAFAIILAAQLSTLFECPSLAQAVNA